MKSVGEVMALGRTFKEALQKALRGLEIGAQGLGADGKSPGRVRARHFGERHAGAKGRAAAQICTTVCACRISSGSFYIGVALRAGLTVREICDYSKIDPWFISQMEEIIHFERRLRTTTNPPPHDLLLQAKRFGFSDFQIAYLRGVKEQEVREWRLKEAVIPTYKSVDTCAAEFQAYTPYYYSTYEKEDEVRLTQKRKIMILGGGPQPHRPRH